MPLGICNQCQCRVGERTANGVYRPFPNTRQVVLEYAYPDRAATTKVHVVVCADCLAGLDNELLEKNLSTDASFVDWKATAPTAVLSRVTEEVANG